MWVKVSGTALGDLLDEAEGAESEAQTSLILLIFTPHGLRPWLVEIIVGVCSRKHRMSTRAHHSSEKREVNRLLSPQSVISRYGQ